MSKIEKVRKLVKNKFEKQDWKYHILPVVKYAKKLAKAYKVNEELVELAALLHDIGRVKIENDEEHHIVGIPEAEKILKRFNYPEKVINEIKHCVASHRTSKGPKPKTMIAKVIANADAMAHFDILPVFFWWRHGREDFEETVAWAKNKIKKDWQKNLLSPEQKRWLRKNIKQFYYF